MSPKVIRQIIIGIIVAEIKQPIQPAEAIAAGAEIMKLIAELNTNDFEGVKHQSNNP